MGGTVSSTDLTFDVGEARRLDVLARLAVSEQDSAYHYRRFLVAVVGGDPAAALAGYVPDEVPLGPTFEAAVRLEGRNAGWSEAEVQRVIARSGKFTSGRWFRVAMPGDTLRVE